MDALHLAVAADEYAHWHPDKLRPGHDRIYPPPNGLRRDVVLDADRGGRSCPQRQMPDAGRELSQPAPVCAGKYEDHHMAADVGGEDDPGQRARVDVEPREGMTGDSLA